MLKRNDGHRHGQTQIISAVKVYDIIKSMNRWRPGGQHRNSFDSVCSTRPSVMPSWGRHRDLCPGDGCCILSVIIVPYIIYMARRLPAERRGYCYEPKRTKKLNVLHRITLLALVWLVPVFFCDSSRR
jgi:hypothetical protein